MSRRRTIGITIALLALGLFFVSGYRMGKAVSAHYETAGRELYVFQAVESPSFQYAGREVRIEDVVGEGGQLRVRVTYGDDHMDIAPTMQPGPAELPVFTRHKDWLRAMQIAPGRGMTQREFNEKVASGEIVPRLVVLVRRPPPGADTDTYAKVWRSEWRYEFLELDPEGGINREILRHPEDPENPGAGDLAPGSWQFEAALGSWGFDPMSVMAPHASPSAKSAREAIEASGWALPAASLSMLTFVIALAVAFAPSGRRGARSSDE